MTLKIPIPADFNPAIHPRAPRTFVELLAWKHKGSTDFLIRQSAATILVATRLVSYHSTAQISRVSLHRYAIARHARKLRALTRK